MRSFPMRSLLTVGAVIAAVVGFAASLTALIDDLGGGPTFCAESGCEIVRASAWARPLGIPMSVLGVGFFAAMLVLAFANAPRLRRWLALAGGAWAVWLIGLQAFAIGAWCKLCLVADPSAIAHAGFVLAGAASVQFGWRRALAIAPAIGAAVVALAAWTSTAPPRAPETATPPAEVAQAHDAVTIVEFVDFECPFCREMQRRIEAALEHTTVPVRVVRKMVPLPAHRGALPAALAWCCADAQGKGDAMARALFATDPEDLTPERCEQIALRLGCDPDRYRADLPQMKDRILADLHAAEAAGVTALPTLFVGSQRVDGASASTTELIAMIHQTAGAR